jgi:phosphoglucosamine mutase
MAVEMKKLFGTDGIRGVANQWPLSPDFVVRVGRAIGQVIIPHESSKPVVVIGRDTRLSGTWASTIETR